MKSFFKEVFLTLILATIIIIGFHASLQSFVIYMSSMEPNFHEGQRLLVNKAVYYRFFGNRLFGDPERGDVVVFHAPGNGNGDYIKRIIGLPGDIVTIESKAVYINGTEMDEPYIKAPPRYEMDELEIPDGQYFVLGDNRNNSNDSHRGWLVPRENIIGKAWLAFWPPETWGVITRYPLGEQLSTSVE